MGHAVTAYLLIACKAEIEPEDLLNALAALLDNRRKQTTSFACNQAAP